VLALAALAMGAANGAAQDKPDVRPRADLRGHRGGVTHIAFHPDGKKLISATREARIWLWDLEARRPIRRIYPRGKSFDATPTRTGPPRRIEAIAFSPDGKMIGEVAMESSLSTALRLWDPATGEPIRVLAEGVENMRCVAFSPDGELVATNARNTNRWGHKIVLRNPQTGEVVGELSEERLAATLLTFSADGKLLASAGGRKIHIWDVPARKRLHAITSHEKAIRSICFSPNGKWLASASADDTIHVWNTETGKLDREIEAEQDGVYAVAFSPTGKTIASAGADRTIKLWSPRSGKMRQPLWGHLDKVYCLAFSPDGKTLASGSADTTVALWDIEEPEDGEEEEEEEE
jgi:WD40 repeat protein